MLTFQLVTILIGHNDFCHLSCSRNASFSQVRPDDIVDNIKNALDFLQDELPYTFVNLVQPLGTCN